MQDLIEQVLTRLPRYSPDIDSQNDVKKKVSLAPFESEQAEDKCVICLEKCRGADQLLSASNILDQQEIGVLMKCGQQCG